MNRSELVISGLKGVPEVVQGDRIGRLILASARSSQVSIGEGDILVVAQKIVSKAEGRIRELETVDPSPLAREWARTTKKDPRLVEVILNESRRIVRMDRGILIVETHHGFVCANAGVDSSNVPAGTVSLLPRKPDSSARTIRDDIETALGVRIGVIITDTFGRPWRMGLVNVALGVAGLRPLSDYRGQKDRTGRILNSTVVAVADELASAAELVMGKNLGIPAALIHGWAHRPMSGSAEALIRPAESDLFR